MKQTVIKILKIFGIASLFLMVAAYFAFSTVMVQQKKGEVVCREVNIHIVDSTVSRMVLQQDIVTFLQKSKIPLIGEKLDLIDLHQLEQLILQQREVEKCEAYIHLNGVLTLRLTQRSPLLRLITSNGSYYLDYSGVLFPATPQRTAYVPVVSGNIPIENNEWIAQLYQFGLYIRNNPFWNAQIEQIYVHNRYHIEMIPRAGASTSILLGNFDHFENKLQKLYTFYRTVALAGGWDQYDRIDLRFNNQIVCRTIHTSP